MAATTESVLGVFAHVDSTVRALEELKAKGYHDLTVYMPVPVHQIEDVLERDRPGEQGPPLHPHRRPHRDHVRFLPHHLVVAGVGAHRGGQGCRCRSRPTW